MGSGDGYQCPAGAALHDRRVPLVVFGLASVDTYFLVQPLSWLAHESDGALWLPLASGPAPLDGDRDATRQVSERVRLPLNWPECHPRPVPGAMRAAALVGSRGRGAVSVFALTALAYGSGIDLEGGALAESDPEDPTRSFLEQLQGRTGIDADQLARAAAPNSIWEQALEDTARQLRALQITSAPCLRWQGRVYRGARQIAPVLAQSDSRQPALFDGDVRIA